MESEKGERPKRKRHCWLRLRTHTWGPLKTSRETRDLRLSWKHCLVCGWDSRKIEFKGEYP